MIMLTSLHAVSSSDWTFAEPKPSQGSVPLLFVVPVRAAPCSLALFFSVCLLLCVRGCARTRWQKDDKGAGSSSDPVPAGGDKVESKENGGSNGAGGSPRRD